ncbi:Nif11-like leader peptide family natural product precursor [Sphaerospermopsis aphanizomenoides BCCUSP55]|uniref:Nif11-like leader peptide family natural product precursor n=1 Tax=Sphaerospermopsis aphanizomenoides TaxID=459663 RepID=UPI0019042E21|nr:Nif11-like leader peptide family natural product precursor [Sphaerospermopsis aphanizomenoides]MBK1985947.1 Nif11-like leader peptide family natural product precursor [Sphaerospermopsis aphanizomenoides BCCUSP55]
MSLQQVESFYEMLSSEPTLYELYCKKCCQQGVFDSCHWDTKKIVNFAATLGYNFTEAELEELWFASEPIRLNRK